MLCYARTGLTEAVVTDPGRAVLFDGRCSLGEGLSLGEARDAIFLLTGSGILVGKPAYLATDPLTVQEGQWAITLVVTKCQIKVRGLGHPRLNLSTPQPFRYDYQRSPPSKDSLRDANSDHQPHHTGPQEAGTTIDAGGIKGNPCLSCHCLSWTMVSQVIGVCYQQLCQCHQFQTDQRDLSVPGMGDDAGKLGHM